MLRSPRQKRIYLSPIFKDRLHLQRGETTKEFQEFIKQWKDTLKQQSIEYNIELEESKQHGEELEALESRLSPMKFKIYNEINKTEAQQLWSEYHDLQLSPELQPAQYNTLPIPKASSQAITPHSNINTTTIHNHIPTYNPSPLTAQLNHGALPNLPCSTASDPNIPDPSSSFPSFNFPPISPAAFDPEYPYGILFLFTDCISYYVNTLLVGVPLGMSPLHIFHTLSWKLFHTVRNTHNNEEEGV